MILGLGVDIVDIERIKQKISSRVGFKELVYSSREIDVCEARANPFESFAAKFAAKEAFLKALGTGFLVNFELSEVEIVNNELGAPNIELSALAEELMKDKFGFLPSVMVSLSHSQNQAVAVVVLS